jgi:hypothetical protein
MRWQARFWTVSTFLTLVVLTFALGVSATLRWIVQKFWKVWVGIGTGLVLMSVPPLAGSPGMVDARAGLLGVTAVVFGAMFGGVFVMISRSAWRNAWDTYLWERSKIVDQLDS